MFRRMALRGIPLASLPLVLLAAAASPAHAGVYGPAKQAPPIIEPRTGAARAQGQVASAQQLVERARDPRSNGKTFLVQPGDYGRVNLNGVRRQRRVTFKAAPGGRPVLGYTTMGNTTGIRLQGLRFSESIDIQPGDNERIQLVRNDIGGFAGVGVNLRERSRHILIAGNHFHDLSWRAGDDFAGYGLRVSSPQTEIAHVVVRGNTFERLGNDAMEIGGVDGLLLERNRVSGVEIQRGSGAHSDPLFIWDGTRHATIRRNRFVDNSQPVYLRGDTADVVFENNLVTGADNWCMQVGGKGLPGDGIAGLVMRNNTVWGCRMGGVLFSGASGGWTLVNNIIDNLAAGPPYSRFDNQGYNLIGRGRHTATDLHGRPRFVDARRGDYRLAGRSRGVDAGTSLGAPGRDLLHHRRWDDPAVRNRGIGPRPFYDVGAFELRRW
jgi:Right handed beta helix region